jgi:hypothetical protein
MSLKAEWLESQKEYEKITGKAKPAEKVKKCWLRSNKTITVTFGDFDEAYKAFEDNNGKISSAKKALLLLQKRFESIGKMDKEHISALEVAIYTDAKDDPVYTKALLFLKKELKALVKTADAQVSSAQIHIDSLEKGENTIHTAIRNFEKDLLASVAQSKAICEKIGAIAKAAAGTPAKFPAVIAAYNENILKKAGPSITVLAFQIQKYLKDHEEEKGDLVSDDAINSLFDRSKKWGTSNAKKLPPDASPEDLSAALAEYAEFLRYAKLCAGEFLK